MSPQEPKENKELYDETGSCLENRASGILCKKSSFEVTFPSEYSQGEDGTFLGSLNDLKKQIYLLF